MRQVLGLAGYFRRFIKNVSMLTAPISPLLEKHNAFEWFEDCESARELIIEKLTETPLLRIFNPNLEIELHTDASCVGIGAALLQKEDGVVRPVAYFSRRTTECEAKYHSYDLETLAVVDAVEHFRHYLYGVHFTVYTDFNSVRATALKKHLYPRVARWCVKLQDYDFSIEYRAGSKMGHVDYLSRNPIDTICVVKAPEPLCVVNSEPLRDYQRSDEFCQRVCASPADFSDYTVRDGIVATKDKSHKCFVPIGARLRTMNLYHESSHMIGTTV
jgi:hypothetical protein